MLDAVPDRGGAGMRPGSGRRAAAIAGVVASLVGFAEDVRARAGGTARGRRERGRGRFRPGDALLHDGRGRGLARPPLPPADRDRLVHARCRPAHRGRRGPGGYPAALGAFAVTGVLIVSRACGARSGAGSRRSRPRWPARCWRASSSRSAWRRSGRGRPSGPGAAGDRHMGGADAGGPPLGGPGRARRRGDRDRRRPARGHRPRRGAARPHVHGAHVRRRRAVRPRAPAVRGHDGLAERPRHRRAPAFGYRPPSRRAREHRHRDRGGRAVRRPRDQPRRDHRRARGRARRPSRPARRWIASVAGGATYLVLGLTAGWRRRWSPSRRRC